MLSVIIPCYNGATYIKKDNIGKTLRYLDSLNIEDGYEVIVVNDGSVDNSANLLSSFRTNPHLKIVSYEKNGGKGYAINKGIAAASGDILFMDIDLATDISAIKQILENRTKYDVIIGSRNHKDSIGGRRKPLLRNIMSFVSAWCVHNIAGVHYADTQCGFKYFSLPLAKKIAARQKIFRWAFDVEYLYMADKNGYRVLEIPVIWTNGPESSVSPIKASIRFLKELFVIRKNKDTYEF